METEPLLHFVSPLQAHRSGRDDEHPLDLLPKQELLQDQACFDGFAQANVVRDEQVGAGQVQRTLERRELVVHQLNARAEWRLKEARIRGRDRMPTQGMEIGREVVGGIQAANLAQPMCLGVKDARAKLQLPKDLQRSALVVIVETDQAHPGGLLSEQRVRNDVLDQVLPMADLDDVTAFGQILRCLRGPREERRRWRGKLEGTAKQSRGELGARPS